MYTNQDILQGQWPELKGQVKQRWGKLTTDNVQRLSGKMEDLVAVLQQRYGYGKVQAEIEINDWVSTQNNKHLVFESASTERSKENHV
jgi:uncharacterized protein YjbJ (UPF0337 family)